MLSGLKPFGKTGLALVVLGTLAALAACSPPTPQVRTPEPTLPIVISGSAAWTAYNHDAARSGVDPSSPPLGHVARAWTSPVLDGAVYAQPLVVGRSVIVATEGDTVYSLSEASGRIQWSRHLGTPLNGSALPCGDINPSGITGTPVVDPAHGIVWAVTFSTPGRHTLWGLRLSSGAVVSHRIADPPGSDPLVQQQRGALAFEGSTVYIPYGGLYGDCGDYHGWVVGLSTDVGDPAMLTYETPTAREGGIWAPPGPVIAADGSIFVSTGNGSPVNVVDNSDSVLRLSPSLRLEASFTPSNFVRLSEDDLDLGSTSPSLVSPGLIFQIGKQGVGYVLSASSLGGVGGELASTRVCDGAYGGTAVDGDLVAVPCVNGLFVLRLTGGVSGGPPGIKVAWRAIGPRLGSPVFAGGDVWAVDRSGHLAGYEAATGSVNFRSSLHPASSFPTLSAASGLLFVPSGDQIVSFRGI